MTQETKEARNRRLRVLYAGKYYDCRPNVFYIQQGPLEAVEKELEAFHKRRGGWLPPKVESLFEELDDLLYDCRLKLGEIIDEYDQSGNDSLLTDAEEDAIWPTK